MAKGETKRDLAAGVPVDELDRDGMIAGRVGEADVLLVKGASGFFAVGAACTHKGGPLAKGVVVGDTVRCPWHHACFDARTGQAVAAPAFDPVERWSVVEQNGKVVVGARLEPPAPPGVRPAGRIVIIGAGAAGAAAADALASLGHGSSVTLIGDEPEGPYDRTMLTKHYLAGTATEEELPLDMPSLTARGVTVRLGTVVAAIEPEGKEVRLADGTTLPYDTLILATGAEPRRLTVPGADLPHVRVLRSADDARRLIAALGNSPRIVIVGASFIGMEAAAALRDRKIDVTVVAPDEHPFAKTLGPGLSDAILAVHRKHGTRFRLGQKVSRITATEVALDDGSVLPADIVLVGIGVAPRTALAEAAGLDCEDGILVDERLRTSNRDILAAGDIARWPDPHGGTPIRVEHWAVAQRQGQVAAANASGLTLRYDVVPFFWTMHFDFSVRYTGHATSWDSIDTDGDLAAKEAAVHFRVGDRELAVATVERDQDGLRAEVDMERRLGGPAVSLPL